MSGAGDHPAGSAANGRRTRANSAPLNARVTLDLANRLRQHLANRGCGNLSDFVSAAIEEKLAREAAEVAPPTPEPTGELMHNPTPNPMDALLPRRPLRLAKHVAAPRFASNWQQRKTTANALSMD